MSKKEEINYEDLKALNLSIQEGLNDMMEFKQELNKFDKHTLSLFITLVIKNENFPETLDLLLRLENLLND